MGNPMRFISLFSGIGGKELGLERAGMQCVAQCEIEPFCRLILEKHWPELPKWSNVRNFRKLFWERYCEANGANPHVDLICGGFPCQDISTAGRGKGITGKRSGLWKEMFRVVREFRPRWVLAENVSALRTRGADTVFSDLESAGYACWSVVVGAWAVGTPHKRDRVWIVAELGNAHRHPCEWDAGGNVGTETEIHRAGQQNGGVLIRSQLTSSSGTARDMANSRVSSQKCNAIEAQEGQSELGGNSGSRLANAQNIRRSGKGEWGRPELTGSSTNVEELADAGSEGSYRRRKVSGCTESNYSVSSRKSDTRWPSPPGEPQRKWESPRTIELPMGGRTHGVSNRVVRLNNLHALRAFGNAVVPDIVQSIGEAIRARHEGRI